MKPLARHWPLYPFFPSPVNPEYVPSTESSYEVCGRTLCWRLYRTDVNRTMSFSAGMGTVRPPDACSCILSVKLNISRHWACHCRQRWLFCWCIY